MRRDPGSSTVHIVFSRTAASSLREAIRNTGLHDKVLAFRDDLSCGPIDPAGLPARREWWTRLGSASGLEDADADQVSWEQVASTDDRLVLWFGRHCAMELAFFFSCLDRLGERSYEVVDITGRQFRLARRDGSLAMTPPALAVGVIPSESLQSLLGAERPLTEQEQLEARARWQRLKGENAPIRVVSDDGLISASEDHFDRQLLESATEAPRTVRRVIGNVMGNNLEPYIQVGEAILLARVTSLVAAGRLILEGDIKDIWSCRVRSASHSDSEVLGKLESGH